MKNRHHLNQFDEALETIEGIIETIEPGMTIRLNDIATKANVTMTSAIKEATIMLLRKYGIRYTK